MNNKQWLGLGIAGVIIVGAALIIFYNNPEPKPETPETTANPDTSSEIKTFELTGRNFAFSQKEIRVNQGDTVRIVFSSTQGFHDWVIDEFNAATKRVNPNTTTEVTFTADKTGTFEYYCSVSNHRQQGMVGTLIVE